MSLRPRLSWTSLALAGTLAACNGSAPSPMRNGISYAELSAGSPVLAGDRIAYGPGLLQFGDLRVPPARKSVPLVVLIHGGCWRSVFDVAHVYHAADALTRAGYATWTIEYRRIGDEGGGWPGTFVDVAHAVDYTRQLAKQFPRLDTSRVVIVGHSAGGHLALWAASRKLGDKLDGNEVAVAPVKVAGVVSLAGITDLRTFGSGSSSCNKMAGTLMGGTAEEFPDRYKAVNPIQRSPIGVPVRFIHGTADAIVPLAQSQSMLKSEQASGGNARLSAIESAGHFDLVAPGSAAWRDVVGAVRALAKGQGRR